MVYFLYSTAAACMNICYDSYPSAKVKWYQLSIYSNRAVNYKTLYVTGLRKTTYTLEGTNYQF